MAKISKENIYLLKLVASLQDSFIINDSEDSKKTKTLTLQSLVNLVLTVLTGSPTTEHPVVIIDNSLTIKATGNTDNTSFETGDRSFMRLVTGDFGPTILPYASYNGGGADPTLRASWTPIPGEIEI